MKKKGLGELAVSAVICVVGAVTGLAMMVLAQGMEELKACDETISRVEEAVMEIQADGSLRVFSGGENEVEE